VDVVVGIVTHRRPASLQTLLERLAVLRFPGRAAPSISVVVVDNSPDLEGRAVVDRASASGLVPVDYVPLGAGNIASGRNEVLRVACGQAPLIALIDDDELPDIEWLHHLLVARHRTAADVVTGPVVADYPAGAPEWLSRSGFHSMAGPSTGRWVDEAYTCNVLVSRDLVRRLALRFDEALGVSGGEDQLFFRQAREGGPVCWFGGRSCVTLPVARPQ
jgi:GT2 family glycosyltransferase